MLELCVIVAVLAVTVRGFNAQQQERYVCPQCGSKRPDGHHKGCSWRT